MARGKMGGKCPKRDEKPVHQNVLPRGDSILSFRGDYRKRKDDELYPAMSFLQQIYHYFELIMGWENNFK